MAKPLQPNLQPAIDRLKAIAAASGDRLLLADGPPNPDAALLELCSVALHHLRIAETAYQSRSPDRWTTDEKRQRDDDLMAECREHTGLARRQMFRAKKLRATTAAGIYAKALCVRCTRTGAAEFAMSLAEDLVNNPTLRASLWAADQAALAGEG